MKFQKFKDIFGKDLYVLNIYENNSFFKTLIFCIKNSDFVLLSNHMFSIHQNIITNNKIDILQIRLIKKSY